MLSHSNSRHVAAERAAENTAAAERAAVAEHAAVAERADVAEPVAERAAARTAAVAEPVAAARAGRRLLLLGRNHLDVAAAHENDWGPDCGPVQQCYARHHDRVVATTRHDEYLRGLVSDEPSWATKS